MKQVLFEVILTLAMFTQCSNNRALYVDVNGNDSTGDGSSSNPWRTAYYALSKVPPDEDYTIRLSAGIFIEKQYLNVPSGVNIEGAGMDLTIIKPDSALYYTSSEWSFDKFLISLTGPGGNQTLRNFSVDGAEKQLYGGILVKGRNSVLIQRITAQYCYFTGIWMWNTVNCRVTEMNLKDNAWGGVTGASASIMLSDCSNLEVDNLRVDEAYGQAMDVVLGKMTNLKVHDNFFSVSPEGNWQAPNGEDVPNIAVEMYNANLQGVEVYNNYFDNSLSLVMEDSLFPRTGDQTIKVYNNVFDLNSRAEGHGYGVELTVNDAEIAHNYFIGGTTGVINWENKQAPARQNWKIHHNIFYGMTNRYPAGVITFFQNGINGAHIYNNTVEMTGTSTINFIEANHGGLVKDLKVENNLVINSNTAYEHYPNKFICLTNARVENGIVRNNFLDKIQFDTIYGIRYEHNINGKAEIQKVGDRPRPYYQPTRQSGLIDAGLSVGASFSGAAPEIGAVEIEN